MSRMIDRSQVCSLLHLNFHKSYELFPASAVHGKVLSSRVLDAMRSHAVNGATVGEFIPTDLVSSRDAAKEVGLTHKMFLRLIKRKHVPHIRFYTCALLSPQVLSALLSARKGDTPFKSAGKSTRKTKNG